MVRFSLTICGFCILFGLMAAGQNSPQIQTGVGGSSQANHNPVYRTRIVPRSPGAGVVTPYPQRTYQPRPSPNVAQRPGYPPRTAVTRNAVAPQKDPRMAGAPAAMLPSAMGPPYPEPEIPKPMRPADMPPVPPQVTFRNGLLTVHAINSTMSSLLSAIRQKTGIEFDGAENSSERVAVSLGPAAEGEVMAGIFAGSSFDYVVLGRADSPDIVQRVILTPKGKAPANGAFAGMNQPSQQPQAQPQQDSDEDAAGDPNLDNGDPDPQDTANQPPPVPTQPPVAQNQDQNNGPKTPEQLLQELKQMQLRQQQQQGMPPPNPNSVPRKVPPQ